MNFCQAHSQQASSSQAEISFSENFSTHPDQKSSETSLGQVVSGPRRMGDGWPAGKLIIELTQLNFN
jgi:hypothetical protein